MKKKSILIGILIASSVTLITVQIIILVQLKPLS